MSQQGELTCVSCETAFEPEPNGGFCPNCDTPHPDFGVDEEPDAEATSEASDATDSASDASVDGATGGHEAEVESGDEAAAPDAESFTYCPDCGVELSTVGDADEESPIAACPDCGRSVSNESFCPGCGTDLDEVREQASEADEADDGASPDDADAADSDVATDADATADADDGADDAAEAGAETVTLVVDGERYSFGDGDAFGRQDGGWLEDLVAAAGGSDDVAFVSSEHLEFEIDDDGAYVVDVSRNGTTLNGTELDGGKAKLADGDTLTLAERAEIEVEL